jgi:hypothetical protein
VEENPKMDPPVLVAEVLFCEKRFEAIKAVAAEALALWPHIRRD